MLLLALFTATLASQLSHSTKLLEERILGHVKQGIQSITQADIDAIKREYPVLLIKPGESIQQVREALMQHYLDLLKTIESQHDPNTAVRQLYESMGLDADTNAKLAVIREGSLKTIAAVTQRDIDTIHDWGPGEGFIKFAPDNSIHVKAGMPVEQVRQRMRENLARILRQAEEDSQILNELYEEYATEAFDHPYTGPQESADALYKYDVERAAYGFKNGAYTQDQLIAVSKSPYFKNAKLDNVPADKLGEAEFRYICEQLRNARDNNDLEYLRMISREG